VLLKGPRTLVATPGRPTRVNLTGTPWLGTAGSGDVLAGLIGSLLASGLDTHDAASLGAFLHGRAADRLDGPLTARDIAATLPKVVTEFAGAVS
jgi:ADP-dependent NAD(P)H-hydrate dehydratase / NAD(P)H-hydrate epimerase